MGRLESITMKLTLVIICLILSGIGVASGNNNNNNNNNNNDNNNNNINIYWGIWTPGIPFWTYCNGRLMDPYAQLCCGGNIHDKAPFGKCCGGSMYNTLQAQCVNGQVKPFTFNCGGSGSYDPMSDFCHQHTYYDHRRHVLCNGNVFKWY